MKISELTTFDVREYARIEDNVSDANVTALLAAATAHIMAQTGLTAEQLDEHEDLTVAALVIVSDTYDKRQLTVDKSYSNQLIDSIVAQHSMNLL